MISKKIIDNLFLGDQYSVPDDVKWMIKASNYYYNYYKKKYKDNIIELTDDYLLTSDNILCLNLEDSYLKSEIKINAIVKALKFIDENIRLHTGYIHCQRGVSRSASIVLMYLIKKSIIKEDTLLLAINKYYEQFYPYISVNHGIYEVLIKYFPNYQFKEVK